MPIRRAERYTDAGGPGPAELALRTGVAGLPLKTFDRARSVSRGDSFGVSETEIAEALRGAKLSVCWLSAGGGATDGPATNGVVGAFSVSSAIALLRPLFLRGGIIAAGL